MNVTAINEEHAMSALIRVAALVALLSATTAFADDSDYSKLDTNGDKSISKEEAKTNADLAAKFDELDADKNGSLSESELKTDDKNRREKRREDR